MVGAATGLNVGCSRYLTPLNLIMVYLLGLVIVAPALRTWAFGRGRDPQRLGIRFLLRPAVLQFRRHRYRISADIRRHARHGPGDERLTSRVKLQAENAGIASTHLGTLRDEPRAAARQDL